MLAEGMSSLPSLLGLGGWEYSFFCTKVELLLGLSHLVHRDNLVAWLVAAAGDATKSDEMVRPPERKEGRDEGIFSDDKDDERGDIVLVEIETNEFFAAIKGLTAIAHGAAARFEPNSDVPGVEACSLSSAKALGNGLDGDCGTGARSFSFLLSPDSGLSCHFCGDLSVILRSP
jgi:hypothetical protein